MRITIPKGAWIFRRSTQDWAELQRDITVDATWDDDGFYVFYLDGEQWEYYPL
jgi:hypothetical protein